MTLTLRVPAMGESGREATLGAWKRAEGGAVTADEPLVEVESEKATLEVPSPGAGVLRKILRKSGETVAVGDVIAGIDQMGAAASTSTSTSTSTSPPTSASASASTTNGGTVRAAPSARRAIGGGGRAGEGVEPSARKAMGESGLAAEDVKGSGRGGRISKQDVDRTLQARA